MNLVISGQGLKIFTRSLRHLARISTELYIEATKESLILRATNQGKTCFLSIYFQDTFFVSYQIALDDYEGNNCRLSIRQLLIALRNIKNAVNCRIKLDAGNEILVVTMLRPQDYIFQNSLRVLEYESLENFEAPVDGVSTIICRPSTLKDIQNIPKNQAELAFDVKEEAMAIRNHICHPDKDVTTVRLQYHLDPAEFITYNIVRDARLIILHHDFGSALEFAETNDDEIKMEYTMNGDPLVVSVVIDDFVKFEMVMATLEETRLESLRKPSGATSYKALIGSYIESRQSAEASAVHQRTDNLSDSEIAKNLSPSISSFGKAARSNAKKTISNQKRRSTDTVEEVEKNRNGKETAKKQKLVDDLTDEIAAAQLLDGLDQFDVDACDNHDGNLSRQNEMSFKLPSTIDGTESEPSLRHDISKANLPSEPLFDDYPLKPKTISLKKKRISLDESVISLDDSMNAVNEEAEAANKTPQQLLLEARAAQQRKAEIKERRAELLVLLEPVLNPRSFDCGTVIVPNSDSSDDD